VLFVFASRRRHTRSKRDWSSDVCSSDLILILLLFPFTDLIVGTIRGPNAALPALIIGSAPFYGRLVEIALKEVDKGVIEAAKSMGAKTSTIIFRVLLPESMPALVSGLTVTGIALIGYTAMAG